jgi:hypothetical protein
MLEEDINVKDKQNVLAVQRIAFPWVRACLEQIDIGLYRDGVYHQECVKGTILHLLVLWSFLELFYGKPSLLERVKLASFIVHIIYMGTEYISHVRHGHSGIKNWLTRECVLNCLIMMMRDFFPHLPIALERLGSHCCEDFFPLLGQHVKNKHNFCIAKACERASHVGRTTQIKVGENAPLFCENR